MLYNDRKIRLDKKGYPTISYQNKEKKVHVLEWEKHNGPKPRGMQIHHKDFNKANWEISNLELVTQSDHFRIHAGWVRGNGEWIAKPCNECNRVLPLSSFYPRKGLPPSANCRKCTFAVQKRQIENSPIRLEKKRKYQNKWQKEWYRKDGYEKVRQARGTVIKHKRTICVS